MNDYNLINSLLEDGSPQAILKLKVIVKTKNFDLEQIKENKLHLFCQIVGIDDNLCKFIMLTTKLLKY